MRLCTKGQPACCWTLTIWAPSFRACLSWKAFLERRKGVCHLCRTLCSEPYVMVLVSAMQMFASQAFQGKIPSLNSSLGCTACLRLEPECLQNSPCFWQNFRRKQRKETQREMQPPLFRPLFFSGKNRYLKNVQDQSSSSFAVLDSPWNKVRRFGKSELCQLCRFPQLFKMVLQVYFAASSARRAESLGTDDVSSCAKFKSKEDKATCRALEAIPHVLGRSPGDPTDHWISNSIMRQFFPVGFNLHCRITSWRWAVKLFAKRWETSSILSSAWGDGKQKGCNCLLEKQRGFVMICHGETDHHWKKQAKHSAPHCCGSTWGWHWWRTCDQLLRPTPAWTKVKKSSRRCDRREPRKLFGFCSCCNCWSASVGQKACKSLWNGSTVSGWWFRPKSQTRGPSWFGYCQRCKPPTFQLLHRTLWEHRTPCKKHWAVAQDRNWVSERLARKMGLTSILIILPEAMVFQMNFRTRWIFIIPCRAWLKEQMPSVHR